MRAEDFVAPNGRLIRKKKPKKDLAAKAWSRIQRTTQKQRKAEKDAALQAKKEELWGDYKNRWCGLCGGVITGWTSCDIGHESSRGLGGGKRDDSKVFLCHHIGNLEQGGMSRKAYLAKFSLAERQAICRGETCPKRERA